ncbi:protein kinase and PP2C-like domain-containing protein [Curcuma longa]|uniref:protein kinase and PP2C-like domain-containing protein n=1 Tax=Curcuma longa TaxID=136217 RepID=UPI003D9EE0DB
MVVAVTAAEADANTCYRGCCSSSSMPLRLPSSSFSLLSPIAKGAESTVFEARLLDGTKVAAKKPVLSTSDDLDHFHRQLQLLCKLDHPGLAKLVAANARPPDYLLFFELYEGRSLAERLHADGWSPSVDQVISIAYDLAKALLYLQNLGIVHRDVKPANILLDKNFHPHLADFGLATYTKDLKHISVHNWRSSGKPTGGFHKKNMVGTLIYMAPEILRKDIHTEKSDVYSFAISINELLTGVVPYTDLQAEAQAHTVLEMSYTEQQLTSEVSNGLRPALADHQSGAPPCFLSLIQRSWHQNPLDRPSFDDIVKELCMLMNQRSISYLPLFTSNTHFQDLKYIQEEFNWLARGEELAKKAIAEKSNMTTCYTSVCDTPHYNPTLSWGSFATRGRREKMEDAHFLLPNLCKDKGVHAFGIFDGHRGAAAAEFASQALPVFLRNSDYMCSPADSLTEAFIKTDLAFRDELTFHLNSRKATQKDWHPGCTAITALISGNKIYVANAGDCRAIISRKGCPIPLSKDHVASCPEERTRVMEEGAEVKWQVDTWRVGSAALQVTRSIGDDDMKPAVTAKPEIVETCISSNDEFLVMASDGLWDVMSNEEVVSLIKDTVKEPWMCSKRLATEAAERGSKDNITVIVVFLRPVSTAERIY